MALKHHLQLLTVVALAAVTTGHPVLDHRASNTTIPLHEIHAEYSLARRQDTGLAGGPQYVGDFTLGSAQLKIIVDTGSTDLVLNTASIPTDGSVSMNSGSSCTEAYGGYQGGTQGSIYQGPYSFSQFSVSGLLCGIDQNFRPPANGIMGLGFYEPSGPTVSGQTGNSPLYVFNNAGLSSFAIYLSSQPGGGGAFTPNDYNQDYIYNNAPFATEDVTAQAAEWSFGLANYQYDGATYDLGVSTGFVDSGNPTINVSPDAASNIWNLVGANSDGTYNDCSINGDPVVIQAASGNAYSIPPEAYVIRDPNGGNGCKCAFQPIHADSTNSQAVLGAPFIKAYYTYFDIDNMQISFAQSAG